MAQTDWFSILAKLCSLQLPKRKIDGKSLAPVMDSAHARVPIRFFSGRVVAAGINRSGQQGQGLVSSAIILFRSGHLKWARLNFSGEYEKRKQ